MAKEFKIFINGFEIDTYDQKSLGTTISYAFADFFTIDGRKNATTRTIKVPATAKNKLFFGYPDDFNSKANIDQSSIPVAKIEGDGTTVLHGPVKLDTTTAINIDQIKDYNLVIQGDSGDWRAKLNGKKVSDLDYSDQDHVLNNATIVASETLALGRSYVYDLIDRGTFFVVDPNVATLPVYDSNGILKWMNSESVTEDCRFPALNISDMIIRAFLSVGYRVEGGYIVDPEIVRLFWIFVEERLRHPDSFNDIQKFHATSIASNFYLNYNTVAPGVTQGYNAIINFLTEDSDTGNNFNNFTTYTAPTNAKFRFKAVLKVATGLWTVGTTGTVYLNIMNEGLQTIIKQVAIPFNTSQTVTIETDLIDLNYGDRIDVVQNLTLDNPSTGFNRSVILAGSTFECTEVSGVCDVHIGQDVNMSINLPSNVTILEFLQGLRGIDNLLFMTDVDKRVVTIEEWDNFFKPKAIDQSGKLDNLKQITTKFIGDSHYKTIRYQFKHDPNDKFVEEWEKQNKIPFGSCDQINTNAYAKDGIEVFENTLFSATWMDKCEAIGFRSAIIPRMWSDITRPGRSTKFNPRILYYAGIENVPDNEVWYESLSPRNTYPKFYSFDDTIENENNQLYCDTDLSHGKFQKNWRNTHKIICEGRLFVGFFYLTDLDISKLDFSFQWYVEIDGNGAYFICNEIKSYDGNDHLSTEVELLKTVSNVARVQLRRVVNKNLPGTSFPTPIDPNSFGVVTVFPTGVSHTAQPVNPYQSMRLGGREIFRVQDNELRVGGGYMYIEDESGIKQVFTTDENNNITPVIL